MSRNRIFLHIWIVCLLLAGVAVTFLTSSDFSINSAPDIIIYSSLFFVSAFCEYVDSSLGMGYGTTLSPLLLIIGIARLEIVPAILLSEAITGAFAAVAHHKEGNINFTTNPRVRKYTIMLAIPAVIGVFAASLIGSGLKSFGQYYGDLYIGVMVISIGIYLIIFSSRYTKSEASKSKLIILGTAGAFNKAVSGGGYGPLITGGQLTAGVKDREAIAITSLCESFACLAALVLFFYLGGKMNLYYAIPLCLGSLVTVVPAAKTVKLLPKGILKKSIGWATLLLGILTLIKFIN